MFLEEEGWCYGFAPQDSCTATENRWWMGRSYRAYAWELDWLTKANQRHLSYWLTTQEIYLILNVVNVLWTAYALWTSISFVSLKRRSQMMYLLIRYSYRVFEFLEATGQKSLTFLPLNAVYWLHLNNRSKYPSWQIKWWIPVMWYLLQLTVVHV